VRPDDLAWYVITAVLERNPRMDGNAVDKVILGNANGAGEDNRNLGRMACLLAGLPVTVPATTVNRLCGSSLDAAMIASRSIETGDAKIIIAGGAESMTRSPWVLMKPDRPFTAGDITAVSTALGWRLINKRMPEEWTVSLGEANEQLQESSTSLASGRTPSPSALTSSPIKPGKTASSTISWHGCPTSNLLVMRASVPTLRRRSWPLCSRRSA
jgi:acetyl-CoA acetyltransferase